MAENELPTVFGGDAKGSKIEGERVNVYDKYRGELRISIFLFFDRSIDDVVFEDWSVLDPWSPVPVLQPEAVVHVGGHAKVALVRWNQNLKEIFLSFYIATT